MELARVSLALDPTETAGRREQARSQQNQRGRLGSLKEVLVWPAANDARTTAHGPGVPVRRTD